MNGHYILNLLLLASLWQKILGLQDIKKKGNLIESFKWLMGFLLKNKILFATKYLK